MRLVTPYFCDDPRPELVEMWRREASGSVEPASSPWPTTRAHWTSCSRISRVYSPNC